MKRYLKPIFWLLIGLLAGVAAFRAIGVQVQSASAELARINVGSVLLVVGGVVGLVAIQSFRFWLASSYFFESGFGRTFLSFWMASFMNTVFPARAGDFFRIDYLARTGATTRKRVLGAFAFDLWIDKIGWIVGILYLWPFLHLPEWITSKFPIIVGVVFGVPALAAFLFRARIRAHFFRLGAGEGSRAKLFASLFLAGPLTWIWEASLIHVLGLALGFSINWNMAFAALTAFNVAMIVPTPGGVGTFEAAGTYALTSLGMAPNEAGSLIIIYHALQLITMLGIGGALFAWKGVGAYRGIAESAEAPAETK